MAVDVGAGEVGDTAGIWASTVGLRVEMQRRGRGGGKW